MATLVFHQIVRVSQIHTLDWTIQVLSSPFLECDCNAEGSRSGYCNKETGQCQCHVGFFGYKCDACEDNFKYFPNCKGLLKSLDIFYICSTTDNCLLSHNSESICVNIVELFKHFISIWFLSLGQDLFSQSGKVSVSKDNHVKTFENYGPEFYVELTVGVLKDQDQDWSNILDVIDGSGSHIMHWWYHNDMYFYFKSTIDGNGDYVNRFFGVKLNFDYKIIESQQYDTVGKLIYTVTVNEQVLYSVENTNPLTINNGLLYLSNPWFTSFGNYGQVSDVTVISGPINEGNQLFSIDKI